MTQDHTLWTLFILFAIALSSVHAIEILYAEPMTTCAKPALQFRPYAWLQEGLANVFFGDTASMRLDPAGANYNTMVQIVGPNHFQPIDIIDPNPPGGIPSLLETACSLPYGVVLQGNLLAGGIMRFTLPEIEQINGYPPNSMRLESYSAKYQYGAISVQPAPAFAALNSGSVTAYTSPTVQGPAINVGVAWRVPPGSILTFTPGSIARVTATSTPVQGRRIQALYFQEMPSGNIIAANTNCQVSAQCVLTYDFTLQSQARNVHVHAIDDAPVAHVEDILV